MFLPLALLLANLSRPISKTWPPCVARWDDRLSDGRSAWSSSRQQFRAGLRLVRGGAPPTDQLAEVWLRNLDPNNLSAAGMVLVLFLGLGWIFAVLGFPARPTSSAAWRG